MAGTVRRAQNFPSGTFILSCVCFERKKRRVFLSERMVRVARNTVTQQSQPFIHPPHKSLYQRAKNNNIHLRYCLIKEVGCVCSTTYIAEKTLSLTVRTSPAEKGVEYVCVSTRVAEQHRSLRKPRDRGKV